MQLRHLFVDQYTSRLFGRSESPRNKVHNAHALWTLVLKPFWELPKKQRRVRLEERITKFRFNFYTLLREYSLGLTKWRPYRERPSSSLSPLATAPSTGAVANDTDTAANKITPADNNTMISDPDSDDGDGEGGKDITRRRKDLPLLLLGFRFSSSGTGAHRICVGFNGKEAL
jgi:hypothetical protein